MAAAQPQGSGPLIGVLAVQGDFDAHARALESAGARAILVKHPADLALVRALILPGGESTTMLKFLAEEQLTEAILEHAGQRKPLFGTCAGAILMAREVIGAEQASLGLLDIGIRRNAYGRQLASFISREECALPPGSPLEMVFIRAPIIERIGAGVEVLAECRGNAVLVRQGNVLAATFHPELSSDPRIHEYFVRMSGGPA